MTDLGFHDKSDVKEPWNSIFKFSDIRFVTPSKLYSVSIHLKNLYWKIRKKEVWESCNEVVWIIMICILFIEDLNLKAMCVDLRSKIENVERNLTVNFRKSGIPLLKFWLFVKWRAKKYLICIWVLYVTYCSCSNQKWIPPDRYT